MMGQQEQAVVQILLLRVEMNAEVDSGFVTLGPWLVKKEVTEGVFELLLLHFFQILPVIC
jgi:hypothetical protein